MRKRGLRAMAVAACGDGGSLRRVLERALAAAVLTSIVASGVTAVAVEPSALRVVVQQWPPLTSSEAADGGYAVRSLRAAVEAAGMQLSVQFDIYPVAHLAFRRDDEIAALFPVLATKAMREECLLSRPVAHTRPVLTAVDPVFLSGPGGYHGRPLRLGYVMGQADVAQLMAALNLEDGRTVPALSDLSNLLRLDLGGIDVAVIDDEGIDQALANSQLAATALKNYATAPAPPQERLPVHLCWRRDTAQAIRERIDAVLDGAARAQGAGQ